MITADRTIDGRRTLAELWADSILDWKAAMMDNLDLQERMGVPRNQRRCPIATECIRAGWQQEE